MIVTVVLKFTKFKQKLHTEVFSYYDIFSELPNLLEIVEFTIWKTHRSSQLVKTDYIFENLQKLDNLAYKYIGGIKYPNCKLLEAQSLSTTRKQERIIKYLLSKNNPTSEDTQIYNYSGSDTEYDDANKFFSKSRIYDQGDETDYDFLSKISIQESFTNSKSKANEFRRNNSFAKENIILFKEETIDGRIGQIVNGITMVNDWGQKLKNDIRVLDFCFSHPDLTINVVLRFENPKFKHLFN